MLFVLDILLREAILSRNSVSAGGLFVDRVQDYCICEDAQSGKVLFVSTRYKKGRYSPIPKLKRPQMSSHLRKFVSSYEPSHAEGRIERLTLQPIQILPLLLKIDILRHPHGQRSIHPPLIQIPLQQDLQILI